MKKDFPRRVHFVGIGGIGMSALAQHLLNLGCEVSGSDRSENAQTEKLRGKGAKIYVPHAAENIGEAELIVRTSAVSESNVEVVEARRNNIPVALREQLLGKIFNGFSERIAVCGTHGKTTVTAMIHRILDRCGIPHVAFIGGEYEGENYFCVGKGTDETAEICSINSDFPTVVVAEACEYNRSFLYMRPTLCVCLNVEFDHPDCYRDLADVENAFKSLFAQSQKVILNANQKQLCPNAVLFGGSDLPMTRSDDCATADGAKKLSFVFECNCAVPCRINLVGEHNVRNATAALTAANCLGLPMIQAAHALANFNGVSRRWTLLRSSPDVICDYAHHPTEVATAVRTAKTLAKSRIYCVFQPHTYSRTKAFMSQFAESFRGVDRLLILPVFPAREKPADGATAYSLFRTIKKGGQNVRYCASFQRAADFLKKNAQKDDLILLVGAGDVDALVQWL